jgi:hypothetical protein
MVAQSQSGSQFLIEVSKLLPGREIMGIITIGFSHGGAMARPASGGNEPGMRDTQEIWAAPEQSIEEKRYSGVWGDLAALPWASRTSPHTKIARDGVITGGAGAILEANLPP